MNQSIEDWIKEQTLNCGFDLVGITSCDPPDHFPFYKQWLNNGYAADMDYLNRHAELKSSPTHLLSEARSIIVVACNYYYPLEELEMTYKVARYALGDDYHKLMKRMLKRLAELLLKQFPELQWRAFVDSGPLMERDLATRAGLGWLGKNTMLIHPRKGSWYLLGCLLTDLDLQFDPPFSQLHCGTCTRCIDACPTNALIEPYTLDSNLCISYLTIENRDSVSRALRPQMENNIFGCDICQEVCPWNIKFQELSSHQAFQPREWMKKHSLEDLVMLKEEQFRQLVIKSPIKRPKYPGFIRNVTLAIGNSLDKKYLPVLQEALSFHEHPMIKEHIEWAIERIQISD